MFKNLTKKATRLGTKIAHKTVENAPVLMFIGGTVAFGATIYLSLKTAPKLNAVLEEHNKNVEEAKKAAADPDISDYTETDLQKDIRIFYKDTFFRSVRVLLPVVATGTLSLGLFGGAQFIVMRRLSALSSEYILLDKTFNDYRQNVIRDQGIDKDKEYLYSTEKTKASMETLDEEGQLEVKEVETETSKAPANSWIFSSETSTSYSGRELYDDAHIMQVEKFITGELERKGLLTRNDILWALGLKNYVKKHKFTGNMFGKVWKEGQDNTFHFNVKKDFVPDYTKGNAMKTIYYISYDEDILYGSGRVEER